MEQEYTLRHQNSDRSYILHMPDRQSGPLPLVIVLHGNTGNAENAMRMSCFHLLAEKEQFIAAFPNGTGKMEKRLLTWNAWNCCGWAREKNVDDVGFMRKLIEKTVSAHAADPKRIYVAGFSNGGMLAYRLACELSERIAAVGVIGGALNHDDPPAKEPVSVMIIHGTEDQFVLYDGGPTRRRRENERRVDKPVAHAVDFWVRRNGCENMPERRQNGSIITDVYPGGKNDTEVKLHTIIGGTHAWPGGRHGIRYGNIDPPSEELDATTELWNFFASHPKK